MKLLLPICLAMFFSVTAFAQTTNSTESDSIYFKDGKGIGGKSYMVEACAEELEKNQSTDLKMNARSTCSCMYEVIGKHYTYKQFMDGLGKKGKDIFTQAGKKGSPAYADVMQCILNNLKTNKTKDNDRESINVPDEPASEKTTYDEAFDKSFMESCVKAARTNKKMKESGLNADAYCSCTLEKIKARQLTVAQLKELQDPQSELFSDIIVPCLTDALKK